jgi:hypothetical protein
LQQIVILARQSVIFGALEFNHGKPERERLTLILIYEEFEGSTDRGSAAAVLGVA